MSTPEPKDPSLIKQALLTIRRLEAEIARLKTPAPVAIVGMACRLPGAETPAELWDSLARGHDAVTETPRDRWDNDRLVDPDPAAPGHMTARHGAFCDGVDRFDADFFNIAPREAHAMDPQQRMLLEVSWEALERANQDPTALYGSPAGVFMGLGTFDYATLQAEDGDRVGPYHVSGTVLSVAAGRLSYVLGLTGPSMTIDTACSSSLVAIHQACRSLQQNECNLALAGGVGLILSPIPSIAFSKAQMLSPRGRCRTFDAGADGYVRGEGCGVVVLKRLADAEADGDTILGIIRGSAVNQDGASGGLTVPSGAAQEAVMREALGRAGLAASDVAYVEAHGTGTPLGDPIELRAIGRVYATERATPLLVGSLKTNFGHLEAAAGVAGLIKTLLSLQHGVVPPHLHFEVPNPNIDWHHYQLAVPREPAPLPAGRRVAAVSAFGFSGTNAHLVIETPVPADAPEASAPRGEELLVISAKSAAALRAQADRHADLMEALPAGELRNYCATAATCRGAFAHRLAVTAATPREFASRLRAFARDEAAPELRSAVVRHASGDPEQTSDRRAAAAAYLAGRPVDWTLLWPAKTWRKREVATTAFQRQRYWFDLASGTPRSLFGAPMRSAALDATLFQFRLGAPLQPLLADHEVQGTLVVAGAVWIAVACDAAARCEAGGLRDVRLPQPLTLGRGAEVEGEIAIHDGDQDRGQLTLMSRAMGSSTWRRCLTAELDRPETALPTSALAALRGSCREVVDVTALYEHARRFGIALGPRFRWLQQVWRGPDEALAHCAPPEGVIADEAGPLHPGLIDAGFQLLLAALGDAYRAPIVPVRCASVRWTERPELASGWWHMRLTHRDAESVTTDLRLLSDDGTTRLAIEGFEARAMLPDWLTSADAAPDAWFIAEQWRERRLHRPGIRELAARTGEEGARLSAAQPYAAYREGQRVLDDVSLCYAAHALHALGWRRHLGLDGSLETIASRFGIAQHQRALFARMLSMLAQAGLVTATSTGYADRLERPLPPVPPADLRDHSIAAEWRLLSRCGPRLPEVLTGKLNPLELLSPAGDPRLLAELYSEPLPTRCLNTLVKQALTYWVERAGPGPIHAIEIGAGTGATTAAVLDALPGDTTRYVFTDVGTTFLTQARERFGDRIETQRLDIEADPASQGVTQESFDIVVAANVLHATRDLAATLAHARQLLAPGGLLVLVEAVTPQRWLDLTFGMTEGWWRFDDDRRKTGHALLDIPGWTRMLARHGFGEISPLLGAEPFGQTAILARAGRNIDSEWLLIADEGGEAARLAQLLSDTGAPCSLTRRSELSRRVNAAKGRLHIVDCTALDAAGTTGVAVEAMRTAVLNTTARGLATLQVAASLSSPARVSILTQGAIATTPGDPVDGLAASALPGLMKVAALELPNLSARLIDIDAGTTTADLLAVLESSEAETLQAVRNGRRLVARIAPAAPERADDPPPALALDGIQLITGGYGGLGLALAEALVAKGARKLALVGRRGPDETIRKRLAQWSAAGVEIHALSADVANEADMRAALSKLPRDVPIRSVFHAAGVLDDALLSEQSAERLARAFDPKVTGALVLHRLFPQTDLACFVLFSSAASLLGSAGQASHAAANAWLDALAAHRRARGLAAISINWGAWSETGVVAGLDHQANLQRLGIGAIRTAQGLDALFRILEANPAQVGVVPLDLDRLLERRGTAPAFDELRGGRDRRQSRIDAAEPSHADETLLAGVLADLARSLGRDSGDGIDPDRRLAELGLDSLSGLDLRNRLQARTGIRLPATVIFDHPTPRLIAAHLETLRADAPSAEPPAATDMPAPSEDALDGLSEDELDALIDMLAPEGTGRD
ncbi:type I polyketide synthase [Bradyrhizobium sp. HKCCYLS3077]|uniref:type I polyketide synthase n=1 Tax=Bradyrhizobium sp. HKCCYLS3077 TaxID=3420761 RepID=UPI003EB83AD5